MATSHLDLSNIALTGKVVEIIPLTFQVNKFNIRSWSKYNKNYNNIAVENKLHI